MHFARYPAWCCHVEHSVDDMIGSERMQTQCGWTLWRLFADLCGWRVLDAGSPDPAQVLTVLGAEYDLSSFSLQQMIIEITERRYEILESGRLSSGQTARIWEKTATCVVHAMGQVRSCQTTCFQTSPTRNKNKLNVQLRSAWRWRLRVLPTSTQREISMQLGQRPVFLIYSDGEGSSAGVGVAV